MSQHDSKVKFQLTFPENLKKDTNLPTTSKLSFDDLGAFSEEREKINRLLERVSETELRVDYTDFANHVFFDSAVSKLSIAKNRVLVQYPYNGTSEDKDNFHLSGTGYDDYIFDVWPKSVGYLKFSGSTNTFFSASDIDKKLVFGTSSLMLSVDVRKDPDVTGSQGNNIVSIQSGAIASNLEGHIRMFFSGGGSGPISLIAQVASGTTLGQRTVSYDAYAYSGSWHNLAAIYDRSTNIFGVYIDGTRVSSGTVTLGPIEQNTVFVVGGGGSGFASLSGAIDNVRLYFTASELLLQKHINNNIDSEEYLKLNYKFNEGITGTGSVDAVIVDYSKTGLHGLIAQYTPVNRVSGTSRFDDPGDPILYSFHSGVIEFTSSLELSATLYDKQNGNMILNLIPEYVLREDENSDNLLQAFSFGMARFFDEIKLYIDQFNNLKSTNYEEINDTPDLFLPYLTRYFGWKVTEHFGEANPLEFFFGEGILTGSNNLEVPLFEIRNQFWRRILNNLPYLIATKGKRNNLDSFFNVLGINRENIDLKEYGYLPGGSIQDTRIHKEKVSSLLGMGTGSFSGSHVKFPLLISGTTNNTYTVETLSQLPFASASYSASLTVLTGAIWQLVDPNQVTGSFTLLWNVPALRSSTGKFILTGSDGQRFSSSFLDVFDGDLVYIAAGLKNNQIPFIEVRTLDNDAIDFSASFTGTVALSGVFTGSKYDFIMGANSGSVYHQNKTHGFYGQYRYWNRALSGSEVDDHAMNFESVGISDPLEIPHPLRAHWPLSDNKTTTSTGDINGILDLSRNGKTATGSLFPTLINPYKKFLVEYNYLSPAIDLKWTENKIRIRNKTFLKKSEVAKDTNEVALEFNLIDALNEDITKIFSTFDILNNAIGQPINKYRDEYSDLEGIRTSYFARLGDSVNFTNFFKLFKWFDKKLSDSIKQLLPTRVKFIGGEQVVESHFLERPRYQYKYPIFRTPVDIPNADIAGNIGFSGTAMGSFAANSMLGTTARTRVERLNNFTSHNFMISGFLTIQQGYSTSESGFETSQGEMLSASYQPDLGTPSNSIVDVEGFLCTNCTLSTFNDGNEKLYNNSQPSDPPHVFSFDVITTGPFLNTTPTVPYGIAFNFSGNLVIAAGLHAAGPNTGGWQVYHSSSASITNADIGPANANSGASDSPSRAAFVLVDPISGIVYVGGQNQSPGDTLGRTWVVKASLSGGTTGSWRQADNIPNFGGSSTTTARAMAIDSSGTLFVCGHGGSGTLDYKWIVRSSSHGGISGTWGPIDAYNAGFSSQDPTVEVPNDILISRDDKCFVLGKIQPPNSSSYAIIRSSSDHGQNWANQVEIEGGEFRVGTMDSRGNLYACGNIDNVAVVYRSTDSGSTWLPYITKLNMRVFNAAITQRNSFEEYLLVAGQAQYTDVQSSGTTSINAYKISDISSPTEIYNVSLTGTTMVWDFARSGTDVYVSFSRFYTSSLPSSPFWSAGFNTRGFLGKITFPRDNEYRPNFYGVKISGDNMDNINNPENSINLKNSKAKDILMRKDRDNK